MIVGHLAETPDKIALCGLWQELYEGQVVVGIEGIPEVWCRDEPPPSYPLDLRGETRHQLISRKMFEDGVGIHDVERLVGERQRAAIEHDSLNVGKAVPVILHIGEGNATASDPRAVIVKGFKLLRQSNAGPGRSHIKNTHLGSRAQQTQK